MISPLHIKQAIERAIESLALSTTKPGPRGGLRVSGGTTEPPAPMPEGITWGKRLLHERVISWASMIGEEQQIVVDADFDDIPLLCWLHKQAHHLAAHDEAQQFLDEITVAVKLIESPYAPRTPMRFLGVHGGGEVRVRQSQELVELEDGRVEHVESVKAWNRDQVLLHEGTAAEVAEMIWEFFGEYINPRKIALTRSNDNDDKHKPEQPLQSVRKDGKNHIYRVYDVLTRLSENKTHEGVDMFGTSVYD